jgi:hypothetical protein
MSNAPERDASLRQRNPILAVGLIATIVIVSLAVPEARADSVAVGDQQTLSERQIDSGGLPPSLVDAARAIELPPLSQPTILMR